MALHLRAEHQFGLQRLDRLLDLEIVVGDQRLDAVQLGRLAQIAGEFAIVAAEPDDFEAELVARDAGGGDGVGRVAEDEDALAGQIGRVRPSGSTTAGSTCRARRRDRYPRARRPRR